MDYGTADDLYWDDEDDFVAVRAGRYRAFRAIGALVVLVVIGFVLYNGIRGWFERQLDPEGEPGEEVQVVIEPGSTTANIASTLESVGVIPNSTFFRYYAEWKGEGGFQAGEYFMRVNSSADDAIEVLKSGPIPPVFARFGVPEGLWISEMIPRIADQLPHITAAELQAVLDNGQIETRYRPAGESSWEGLLFPAFYDVEDDIEPVEVLAKMSEQFSKVTSDLGYGAAESRLNLSAYELVVIASMIQSEARTEPDRARISRVIHNRIRDGMSLDIDATCIYGAGDRKVDLNSFTREELATSFGSYSCRDHPRLPATPISAPGRASLEAAINPSEEPGSDEWLYYVLKDSEHNHFFTGVYDEFLRQKNLSQEQGLF